MSFVGAGGAPHGFEHSKGLTKCWRETATCWTLSVQGEPRNGAELAFLRTSPAVPSSPSLRSITVSLGFSASAGAGFPTPAPVLPRVRPPGSGHTPSVCPVTRPRLRKAALPSTGPGQPRPRGLEVDVLGTREARWNKSDWHFYCTSLGQAAASS